MLYFKEENRKTIPLRITSIFLSIVYISNKQLSVICYNVSFKMVLIWCTTFQHIFGDLNLALFFMCTTDICSK